jgi:hypothetical protein
MANKTPNFPVGQINPDGFPLGGFTRQKKKAFEIAQRRELVSKYMLQKYPVYQIANMLNSDRATIYRDIKVLFQVMKERSIQNLEERNKARVKDFEHVVNFCWRRIELIKNPSAGSKFIEEIRKCYIEICKLEGLYPEKSVNVKHTVEKLSKSKRDAIAEAAVNSENSSIRLLTMVKDGTTDS